MIASTIVSAVAFITIVVVSVVIAQQVNTYKENADNRIRNVVDQINTSQQYGYEFDKRQQQKLTGLQKNVDDIRATYVSKDEIAKNLKTKQVEADDIASGNIYNSGKIQLNSTVQGAMQSPDFSIQRGDTNTTMNNLVIKTPSDKGSGVNFMSTGGVSRMFVDGNSGQVSIPVRTKTNTLIIGSNTRLEERNNMLNINNGVYTVNSYVENEAQVKGNLGVQGTGTFDQGISVVGGASTYNIAGNATQFNAAGNIIGGDTTFYGTLDTLGDFNNQGVALFKDITTKSAKVIDKLQVNHDLGYPYSDSVLSAYAGPNQFGAALGGPDQWSHLPWSDGNTYIRPGVFDGTVFLGDTRTSNIKIGGSNTIISSVNDHLVNGKVVATNNLCVNTQCINETELVKLKKLVA